MEEKPWDLKDMEALWDATSAEALGDWGFCWGWELLEAPEPPPNASFLLTSCLPSPKHARARRKDTRFVKHPLDAPIS